MNDAMNIDAIAAKWVAREDRGALDPDQVRERDAWLDADRRHRGAYIRAQAVFLRAGRASALDRGHSVGLPPGTGRHGRLRARWLLPFASAAVLALAFLGMKQWLPEPGQKEYRTDLGEVLRVVLDDGSSMTLNSGTQVQVRYSNGERRVVLLRGETLVNVVKDAGRPFLVRSGTTDVVAVGTSFSVRRGAGEAFEVLVTEGVVDIRQPNATVEPLRVRANYVVASRQGTDMRIEPLATEVVRRRLSWREGLLSFEGDTLADAAMEFARYSDVRILIDDPEIAGRKVVGVYSSTDPEGFAKAVADSFGFQIENVPQGVYLRASR